MRTLQLITAIGFAIFWIVFFTIGFDTASYPKSYLSFEHSFPLPDTFIVLILLLAWWYRNQNTSKANHYTRVAGGAMIFLGLCDFSYNFLHGIYTIGMREYFLNGFINVWCIVFGAIQAFKKLDS